MKQFIFLYNSQSTSNQNRARAEFSRGGLDRNFVKHYISVMRNVTITLEEKVARWARIRAAELDTSVSRLVGEILREKMLAEESYQASMQQYLSQDSTPLKDQKVKYPPREELYDRQNIR
ncbi:hypothetical protein ACFL27_08495 [candidate division CSSED10-310 bacterium]|uniref:CopG family transcriptional regulator n=1 Tax=candidate division CSSED10-310 bacterium TaxID=2855610 RepID=A0ABV6YVM1_UNCC1